MTQISAVANDFVVRMAGSGAFLPTAGDAAATCAQIGGSLIAPVKEKGTSGIKCGLVGALSLVTTGAMMWLVGFTMNYAFN